MSRKSLSKKEAALWYQCNNCNWNIIAKDREQHVCNETNESIQTDYTFVCNKKLSTNQVSEKPATEDLRGINSNKLNTLLFLHESIFPLCDLVLGDYVLVSSPAFNKTTPIVRTAWPISSQNYGLVCVSNKGMPNWNFNHLF